MRIDSRTPQESSAVGISRAPGGYRLFAAINGDLGVFAFHEDGSPDRSYGKRGWRLFEMARGGGAEDDLVRTVTPAPNGRTLVAGGSSLITEAAEYQSLTMAMFRADGRLDRSFGKGGLLRAADLNVARDVSVTRKSIFASALTEPVIPRPGKVATVPGSTKIVKFTSAGAFDRRFGRNGVVTMSKGNGTYPRALVADGKGGVFVALVSDVIRDDREHQEFELVHLNQRGKKIQKFGNAGYGAMPDFRFAANDAIRLPDGRLVVVGYQRSTEGAAVLVYRPDGQFDRSFSDDGQLDIGKDFEAALGVSFDGSSLILRVENQVVKISLSGDVSAQSPYLGRSGLKTLLVKSDHSVLFAGNSRLRPVLTGLKPDLTADPAPAEAGLPQEPVRLSDTYGFSSLLGLTDGFLLGGSEQRRDDWVLGFERFRPDGHTDHGFGGGKRVLAKPDGSDIPTAIPGENGSAYVFRAPNGVKGLVRIRISKRGNISVRRLEGIGKWDLNTALPLPGGGFLLSAEGARSRPMWEMKSSMRIIRYDRRGNLDRSFGHSGSAGVGFKLPAIADALDRDRHGRIIAAGGRCSSGFFCGDDTEVTQRVSVARFLANGKIDRSFGRRGRVQYGWGRQGAADEVVVLRDGSILMQVTYICRYDCPDRENLMKLNPDGTLDRSFGHGGRLPFRVGRSTSLVGMYPAGPDGAYLAGTVETCAGEPRYGVARIDGRGHLDHSFGGGDGLLLAPLRGSLGDWASGAVRRGSSLTMAGWSYPKSRYGGSESAKSLVRFNLNGSDGGRGAGKCGWN